MILKIKNKRIEETEVIIDGLYMEDLMEIVDILAKYMMDANVQKLALELSKDNVDNKQAVAIFLKNFSQVKGLVYELLSKLLKKDMTFVKNLDPVNFLKIVEAYVNEIGFAEMIEQGKNVISLLHNNIVK